MGRSSFSGFYIYGRVDTEELAAAASEALARLQNGESDLAVHPRCGTNIVTAGVLAGLSTFTVMAGRSRSRWEEIADGHHGRNRGHRAGPAARRHLQSKVTTSADVQGLRIVGVKRQERGEMIVHHVEIFQE